MISKIIKAIKDPALAFQVLRRRYLRITFFEKVFANSEEYRSDSENGKYAAAVLNAVKNQKSFENFKRNPAYREILEHVSEKQGEDYLNIVKSRADGLLESAFETVLVSDTVGNPNKYKYNNIDVPLSPTTLRYVKVASDLMNLFGKNIEHVAEIGCGYGGQCLVNEKLLGFKFATLFDLPFVNQLIKRYLDYTLMNGAFEVTSINEKRPNSYGLVISNYAFSELPRALQEVYVNKVLANSERGYLTMNSGIGGDRDQGKMSLEDLRKVLPKFECFEEYPLTSPYNYIIVWGHNMKTVDNLFDRKIIE